MSTSWKIKGKGLNEGIRVSSAKYFLENNCVSCGWGEPALKNKGTVVDFKSYKVKWIEMYYPKHKWGYQGVHHLFESIEKGDFLWVRLDGEYYVTQVTCEPKELFYLDFSDDAQKYDCVVQLRCLNWKKCGTEESVPGSVSTFSSNRKSLIRIDNKESRYNGMTATSLFAHRMINLDRQVFIQDRKMILNLLGPTGLEDLVSIWLFDKFGYFAIPSTNKLGTQNYEFVLMNGKKVNNVYTRKMIYLQVKNGNVDLRIHDFKNLLETDQEVWLVTSGGTIFDLDNNAEYNQIVRYYSNNGIIESSTFSIMDLVSFVFDRSKHPILPDSILTFLDFFN